MVAQSESEVVISGIAGFLPRSNDVQEFAKHLFDNEYIIDDARWKKGQFDICNKAGVIPEIRRFDPSFFFIHRKQARFMDPMQRIILEATFEALTDAGINLNEVKGKRIGVFMGSTISENDSLMFEAVENGFGVTGQARTMLSNRISYWLNVTGPSCSVDASWTGGLQTIQIAYEAIKNGQCEAAIVGAVALHLNVAPSYCNKDMGFTCMDGIHRSFDENASGYVRSDTAGVLILQRSEDAKKHYASIVHADVIYNGDHDGAFMDLDRKGYHNFIDRFYKCCGVNPRDVQYLEAFGNAIKSTEELELNVAEEIFCKDRNEPLPIGSVKSNAGHAEAASDIMSIFKVLIAMQSGVIPANLNYETPNKNIPGLTNGSFEVVTKNKQWNPGYAAINSFGIASSFGHLLLKANTNTKKSIQCDLPLLKVLSARNEEGLNELVNIVSTECIKNLEYTTMLNNVFCPAINGHLFRGYVLNGIETKYETGHFPGNKKQIWFVYSGMGSQWPQMGKELMRLPLFAASIEKCHNVLEPFGLNLKAIVTENDPKIFDNILHSFVGIAAIQIGLTDILHAIGIKPDGMVGHSVGELGCAYADGCITAEQMILSAYYRGKASLEVDLIPGMMAAVGIGSKKLMEMVPPSIDVACHNGPDSATLSGPKEDMQKFVTKLQADGVFARLVNVSNIAYHSQYIKPAAPLLLEYLKKVITDPVARSTKWISTSVEESKWSTDLARTCSAEYLTNNLLSSVYFEEGSRYIPRDSIVIEIAPHGLLQAILKRSLPVETVNVSLTNRGNEKGLEFLLTALGKLYITGIDLDLKPLYPKVSWPVPKGTPALSKLIRWGTLEEWRTGEEEFKDYVISEKDYVVNLNIEEFQHIIGFKIGRKYVVPPSSLLVIVFDLLSSIKCPVLFEDISIKKNILQTATDSEKILIALQRATGLFEISAGNQIILMGKITLLDSFEKEFTKLFPLDRNDCKAVLSREHFYNELHGRGYDFQDDFVTLKEIQFYEDGALANLEWKNNWSAMITSLIQIHTFREGQNSQDVLLPKFIRRILVDFSKTPDPTEDLEVHFDYNMNELSCNLAQISDIEYKPFVENENILTMENYEFVKYYNDSIKHKQIAVDYVLQIILQNLESDSNIFIYNFKSQTTLELSEHVENFKNRNPLININCTTVENPDDVNIPPSTMFILGENNIQNIDILIKNCKYLLLCLPKQQQLLHKNNILTVVKFTIDDICYYLLKNVTPEMPGKILNVNSKFLQSSDLDNDNLSWISDTNKSLSNTQKVCLVFKVLPLDGLDRFVNTIRKKYGVEKIRLIFVLDKNPPECKLEEPFYKDVFQNNLLVNILENGVWGNYLYNLSTLENDNRIQLSEICLRELKSSFDLKYLGINPDNWICDDGNIHYKMGPMDYSAIDKKGNRIMGVAKVDMERMEIIPDPILRWNIPERWTFHDGATVPFSYCLTYYILEEMMKVKPDSLILVHNAATSLGRALCQRALAKGYDLFISVGSEAQRAYFMDNMRPIEDAKILDYTDTKFEQKLMLCTNGKGADIIVNCLPHDRMRASYRCVSMMGQIVQLNMSEEDEDSTIGLNLFASCLGLYGLNPSSLLDFPDDVKQKLHDLIEKGLAESMVWYHEKKLFSGLDINSALRYLQSKTVIGCALISADELYTKDLVNVKHYSHFRCDKNSAYIIYGDDVVTVSGVAQRLAIRGCQKLVIVSNTNDENYLRYRVEILREFNKIDIKLVTQQGRNTISVSFLKDVNKYAPISTVFVISNASDEGIIELLKELDLNLETVAKNAKMICLWNNEKNNIYKRMNSSEISNVRWCTTKKFCNFEEYFGRVLLDNIDVTIRDQKSVEEVKLYKDFNLLLPETGTNLLNIQCDNCSNDGIDLVIVPSKSMRVVDVPPYFIIPDMLGLDTAYLRAFIRKLMYPTYVVHLNQQASADLDMCVPIVAQKIKDMYWRGPYNLVGISWGGALAIEVAKELETISNKKVTLFLLDAIPETIKSFIEEERTDDDHFEINLLKYLLHLNQDEANRLLAIKGWKNRVEYCVSLLKYPKKKHQRMIHVLNLIKTRIDTIMSYKPHEKQFNGSTHLFIPAESMKTSSLRNLAKFCKQIKAEIVPGNHFSILQEDILIDYMNEKAELRIGNMNDH